MSLENDVRKGIASAKAEIAAVRREQSMIASFLNEFADLFPVSLLNNFGAKIEVTAACVAAVDLAKGDHIAELCWSEEGLQFLYSDFREIPKIPLPPNLASHAVAATYFGIALEWFRCAREDPRLRDICKSIHLDRDTLKEIED